MRALRILNARIKNIKTNQKIWQCFLKLIVEALGINEAYGGFWSGRLQDSLRISLCHSLHLNDYSSSTCSIPISNDCSTCQTRHHRQIRFRIYDRICWDTPPLFEQKNSWKTSHFWISYSSRMSEQYTCLVEFFHIRYECHRHAKWEKCMPMSKWRQHRPHWSYEFTIEKDES